MKDEVMKRNPIRETATRESFDIYRNINMCIKKESNFFFFWESVYKSHNFFFIYVNKIIKYINRKYINIHAQVDHRLPACSRFQLGVGRCEP